MCEKKSDYWFVRYIKQLLTALSFGAYWKYGPSVISKPWYALGPIFFNMLLIAVNNVHYIPHIENPAIWLVRLAGIFFNMPAQKTNKIDRNKNNQSKSYWLFPDHIDFRPAQQTKKIIKNKTTKAGPRRIILIFLQNPRRDACYKSVHASGCLVLACDRCSTGFPKE